MAGPNAVVQYFVQLHFPRARGKRSDIRFIKSDDLEAMQTLISCTRPQARSY